MFLRIRAVARKEFIQIFRDSRTLFVVIVLPIVMLVIYGFAINMDVKHLRVAVLDQDKTSAARDLVYLFRNSEYFDVVRYPDSLAEVDRLIDDAEARLAICIPRGYAEDIARGRRAQVLAVIDGSDSTIASLGVGYTSAAIQGYSNRITLRAASHMGLTRTDLFQPVDYQPRVWYNPELRSTNFIVPGLIAVILMMLSGLLTSMTIVRERERGTIEQLIVSPVMPHELMIGKLLPYVAISFVDIVVVIAASLLVFHVPMHGSILLLLALSAVFLVAALGIGMLVSVISKTQQIAMTIAIMGTMLPSILLSGFVFPIISMPRVIQIATNLIPARHFLIIIRGIFLKGVGMRYLWPETLVLAVFGLVVLALAARRFRKQL